MHIKYNKFLIVTFVILFLIGLYSYFYKGIISETVSAESSLSSSLEGNSSLLKTNNKIAEDISFLADLDSLKRINIDTSLFSNQSFTLLVDNNIKLEPVSPGRINPFSPVLNNTISTTNSLIKTEEATFITNNGAMLNGSIEGSSGNIYFEYGLTERLGNLTPRVGSSLVGAFNVNINGLNSKTTYFYRAAANINGVVVFGEIRSFKTN